jgi:hypothetical protein
MPLDAPVMTTVEFRRLLGMGRGLS